MVAGGGAKAENFQPTIDSNCLWDSFFIFTITTTSTTIFPGHPGPFPYYRLPSQISAI
jgi:hypothetical protein